MKFRMLVVDDHKTFREAVKAALQRSPQVAAVAEAGDGLEALDLAGEFRPDIVFMDMRMPRLNGIEATRRLLAARADVKVVGLSAYSSKEYVREMLRAGAMGYITKDEVVAALPDLLSAAAAGKTYLSPSVAASMGDSGSKSEGSSGPAMTARQQELLRLLGEGHTLDQVAERLGTDMAIIDAHCRNLMRSLKLAHIDELSAYARGKVQDSA